MGATLRIKNVLDRAGQDPHGLLRVRTRQPPVLDQATQQTRDDAPTGLAQLCPAGHSCLSPIHGFNASTCHRFPVHGITRSKCHRHDHRLVFCGGRHATQQMGLPVAGAGSCQQQQRLAALRSSALINGGGELAEQVRIHSRHGACLIHSVRSGADVCGKGVKSLVRPPQRCRRGGTRWGGCIRGCGEWRVEALHGYDICYKTERCLSLISIRISTNRKNGFLKMIQFSRMLRSSEKLISAG